MAGEVRCLYSPGCCEISTGFSEDWNAPLAMNAVKVDVNHCLFDHIHGCSISRVLQANSHS